MSKCCHHSQCKPATQWTRRLTHEAGEALVRARHAHLGAHVDEHVFGGADVDLEVAGLVERRVEHGHELLVQDVRARLRRLAVELLVQALVVVAVEQLVALGRLHGLQRRLLQDDDHLAALLVFFAHAAHACCCCYVGVGVGVGVGVRCRVARVSASADGSSIDGGNQPSNARSAGVS